MRERNPTQHRRIDPDHREPSPSAGSWRVAVALDATAGADHERSCTTPGCDVAAEPVAVADLDRREVTPLGARCVEHARDVLGVST